MNTPAYAAIYGRDTMVFGRGDEVPGEYGGKTLKVSYRDIESIDAGISNNVPWYLYTRDIITVYFDNPIKPMSTAQWFLGFNNLTSVYNIEMLDTSGTINMYGMFSNCTSLTSLDLSSFDTSSVTNMANMFEYCTKLRDVNLNGFDTSNVVNMKSMFDSCAKLSNLDLSSFNTSNVSESNMSSMFRGCTTLKTIYVSSLWVSAKKSYDMFANCTSITGGEGTVYSEYYRNEKYARIDGGTSAPGYFTEKAA